MQGDWQPIETAPRDRRVLLWNAAAGVFSSQWVRGSAGWVMGEWDGIAGTWWPEPTHWMPLPAPPKETRDG